MSILQPEAVIHVLTHDGERLERGAKADDVKSKYAKFDTARRKRVLFWIKVTLFSLGVVSCVLSWTVPALKKLTLGKLAVWRWCVLITVLLAGLVVSQVIQRLVLLLVEHVISMKENVIYYIVGTIETVSIILWFGFILFVWGQLVDEPLQHPTLEMLSHHEQEKVRQQIAKTTHIITLTLITILLGSFLVLLKNVVVLVLKSSFHVRRFYLRVKKTLTDRYIIETLLADRPETPKVLIIELKDENQLTPCCNAVITSLRSNSQGKRQHAVKIHLINDLENVDEKNVSCWGMKILIKAIMNGKPPSHIDDKDKLIIDSEEGAMCAADFIFSKIFPNGTNSRIDYKAAIQNYFMARDEDHKWLYEVAGIPQLDDGAGPQEIKDVFRRCMVRAWRYRESLVQALIDNKQIFTVLNSLTNLGLAIIIILIWLVTVHVEFRRAVFVVGSAIVGSAVAFGDICKTLINDFTFVFVVHPFDVGDYCLIEGVEVIINRMHLLSTVAMTLDNEEKHYSNSRLCNLDIVNYSRSPHQMGDSVEFYLDVSTTYDQIKHLKDQIKSKIFKEDQHYWLIEHELVMVLESQAMKTKIKATLRFKHNTTFHDFRERESRKSKLVSELKVILDELKLTTLLLQSMINTPTITTPPSVDLAYD